MNDLMTQPIVATPPTALIPTYNGHPMLPTPRPIGVATYDTRSRAVRWLRSNPVVIGLCAPAPLALAYAIAQLLTGGSL